jgi:hypothetical protein
MVCKAKTKSGSRCKNLALVSSKYCHIHRSNTDSSEIGASVVGALIGNLVLPGLGGAIGGTIIGNLANKYYKDTNMVKKKVFVSFDFDNDKKLKDFIIGQSRLPDSPFVVVDNSLKEAAPEQDWEAKANRAIKRSDIVIVMVGPQTHRAHGVLKEVRMARAANKHIVQVIGYKNGDYKQVKDAGRLYMWNWENLKKLLK